MKTNYESIDARARIAANAMDNPYFKKFVEKLQDYPNNSYFTVETLLGQEEWKKLKADKNTSSVAIGRIVSDNIKCNNLTGLKAEASVPGKPQTYKKEGEVILRSFFMPDFLGEFKDMKELKNQGIDSQTVLVKCWRQEKNEDGDTFTVEILDNNYNTILSESRVITEKFFTHYIDSVYDDSVPSKDGHNDEFKAIICLWYAYERVYELREELTGKEITKVVFIAPDPQMMRRVCGEKFNSTVNKYDYTGFIQNVFFNYTKDGLKELGFTEYVVTMPNNKIKIG